MRIYTSDGNAYVWQWQPKEHIVLDGYPDGVFVHYANCDTAKASVVQTRRESGKLIADIPPELMMTDKDITVYVCDVDGTMHCHFLSVIGRPKPASYIYEPVEVLRYETLAERVRALEERPNNGTGGSVDLDDTLTKSGMAADAKATGDEIKRVEGKIPSIEGLAKTEDIPTKPEDIGAQPKGDYLTAVPAGYATEEFVKNKIAEAELGGEEVDLSGYAQKSELPTKVSQLENDKGYLTAVPDGYAKTEDIPKKPADIGAQPAGNYALKAEIPSVPVQSVNGKTGAVNLTAADVGARAATWMPTAQEVGALPSTYTPPNQTAEQVGADAKGTAASAVSDHNTNNAAHNDIRLLIEGLTTRLNALANSTDTDLDQMAEIVAYIKSNKSLIDGITTSKVSVADIVNNLTTNVANKPLSAAQGVAIKALIDGLSSGKLDASKLQEAINTALAQAKANGEFDGAKGDPGRGIKSIARTSGNGAAGTVDTYTITYTDGATSTYQVRNGANGAKGDKGEKGDTGPAGPQGEPGTTAPQESVLYIAQNLTEAQKAQARANIGATAGEDAEFADSIEWLAEHGDTTKKYVLPDGYIYAWMDKTVSVEHNANDGTGYLNCLPQSTWGNTQYGTYNGLWVSPLISIDPTKIAPVGNPTESRVVISGIEKAVPAYNSRSMIVWYYKQDGSQMFMKAGADLASIGTNNEIALPKTINLKDTNIFADSNWAQVYGVRIGVGVSTSAITQEDVENLVVNMPALNYEKSGYGWYSTGQQHSNDKATQQNSADIATLKEEVETLKAIAGASGGGSGANWYAIGDSITYGLYSTSATDYSQPVIGKRWVDYVAQYNGYKLTNLGVSGAGFVTGTTFRTVVDRNNFASVDLVTIMLGINDWKNEAAVNKVGTITDSPSTGGTIMSELRYGLEKIIADNPYCKIILITPINAKIGSRGTEDTNWAYGYTGNITPAGSLKNFNDKLKEVCEYLGIQVVDMANSSIVNRKSITTVLPDGIHPNLNCYKALGLELARKITFA